MTLFQITFVWPNDDWTWTDVEANDFHQAMLFALDKCPATCRVKSIERLQAGKDYALALTVENSNAR
jgi:hypothetical protein